jgi:hypothetical protein
MGCVKSGGIGIAAAATGGAAAVTANVVAGAVRGLLGWWRDLL